METLRVLCEVPTETLYIMYWYTHLDFRYLKLGHIAFFYVLPYLMLVSCSTLYNNVSRKGAIKWATTP
jgi:hypothetical protein